MPLYYSLRALSTSPELGKRRDAVDRELRTLSEFLLRAAQKQEGDPLFSAIERLRAALGSAGGAKRSEPPLASKPSRVKRPRR
jgi:hypothetical protein